MTITKGLLVRIESRDETKDEVEAFLKSALPLANQEADTIAWFAVHFGGNKFGVFDVFGDESGRQAHLSGAIAKALMEQTPLLLAKPPQIHTLDIIAHKLPHAAFVAADTKALLLTFKPQAEHEESVHQFLLDAQAWVEEEPDTTAWFSIRLDDGIVGIFDVFPSEGGRLKHLTGKVARELALHAFRLLSGLPDPELLDLLAEKL